MFRPNEIIKGDCWRQCLHPALLNDDAVKSPSGRTGFTPEFHSGLLRYGGKVPVGAYGVCYGTVYR
jgi:hypothetical protein